MKNLQAKKTVSKPSKQSYELLFSKGEYDKMIEGLARDHKRFSPSPFDLIVGYVDKKTSRLEFHLLEVEKVQIGPPAERLNRYYMTESKDFPVPLVVTPCSWEELEKAAQKKDEYFEPFRSIGKVYLGDSEAKKHWENIKKNG